jgi:hypothetical protein
VQAPPQSGRAEAREDERTIIRKSHPFIPDPVITVVGQMEYTCRLAPIKDVMGGSNNPSRFSPGIFFGLPVILEELVGAESQIASAMPTSQD